MADRSITTRRGGRTKQRPAADDHRPGSFASKTTNVAAIAATLPAAVLLSAVTGSLLWFAVRPLFGPAEYFIDEEFHVPQARRYCRAEFREVRTHPTVPERWRLARIPSSMLPQVFSCFNTTLRHCVFGEIFKLHPAHLDSNEFLCWLLSTVHIAMFSLILSRIFMMCIRCVWTFVDLLMTGHLPISFTV